MATTVSIAKKASGANAVGKNKNVILIDVDDIAVDGSGNPTGFPGRDGVLATGNITLKAGAKALALYCTQNTIKRKDESEGEGDTRKVTSTFEGEHPGDHADINNLLQAYINKDLIIVTRECANSTGNRIQGTPCNPMRLNFAGQDDNEAIKKMLTATQDMGDGLLMLHYTGTIPAVYDYAVDDSSSGAGGI